MESILSRRTNLAIAAWFLVVISLGSWTLTRSVAEEKDDAQLAKGSTTNNTVVTTQRRLGKDFGDIEKLIARLQQSLAKADPKKAEILKQAFASSKQNGIAPKFDDVVTLLNNEEFKNAMKSQDVLQQDLRRLLELLQSGDQDRQLEDEREYYKKLMADIKALIKTQSGLEALTENEGNQAELAKQQDALAGKTGKLAKEAEKRAESKNGESKSGGSESGDSEKGKSDSGKGESGDSKSGKSKSGDNKSGDNKSGDAKSGDKKSGDKESGKSDSGKKDSGDSKSGDAKSGDNKSGDNKSGDSKSGKSDSGKKESGDSKSGDSKSGDNKSGDSKSGDSKSGDSESGKKESGKSESGKSESGKSESKGSKSGDSKSGDSKSGDSKSGDTKSGKSESGKSESGKSESGKSESGDTESGDSKSGDSKSGDSKSGDSKSGDKQIKPGDPSEPMEGGDEPPQSESEDAPAKKRLRAAEEKMKEAKIKLENAKRNQALKAQQQAKAELEKAVKELEEILKQLREEEMERMLAQLEARFRKMLEFQVQVYKITLGMDNRPENERDRDFDVEAIKLSRTEKEKVLAECDKAMMLLREEGSAVAFAEAAELMRDDMEGIVKRLEKSNTSVITQGLETDVIKSLEEMIAALQKAQQELKAGGAGKSSGQSGGGPGDDPPLVDQIAELKMIRAMQERILLRTRRYGKLITDAEGNPIEQAEKPELVDAIKKLGERQERLQKVTREIVVGKNQ